MEQGCWHVPTRITLRGDMDSGLSFEQDLEEQP